MPADTTLNEVLITPLSSMVREIGRSVADAQRALDAAALAQQDALAREHPELQAMGYQVTWYQIPEASVEMKVAVHLEQARAEVPARLYFSPFDGRGRQATSTDGSSTLRLRIVPVPPVTGA